MSVDARALFSGMKNAKGRVDANYVRAGHYWAKIEKVKIDTTRSGDDFFAVEMQVVNVFDNDDGRGHRLNEAITHMMMARHDSFMGNVKAFIAKVFDLPEAEIGEDAALEVVGEDQPLASTVCEFRARTVMTKKNTPFTQIDYVREVPITEVAELSDPEVLDLAFPNGSLKILLAD